MTPKKKYTAVVVDDERLARKAMVSLLEELPEIVLLGEADCVEAAVTLVNKEQPDIIFLDIQMPGESGFDLPEKINSTARIIFVTAFDEYALRAFEINALDYLMKPVSLPRLKASIERLNEENQAETPSKKPLFYDDRLFILFTSHYIFLKVESIVYICSSGDYSEVHLTDGRHGLTNKTMQEWEERLPDKYFCRIHRSVIINMDFVVKVDEWFNNAFRVHLKGVETPFVMSRRYASLIKNRMG
jgi:two-component system LytT family response regulator